MVDNQYSASQTLNKIAFQCGPVFPQECRGNHRENHKPYRKKPQMKKTVVEKIPKEVETLKPAEPPADLFILSH